eukprot:maker-scaffold580_size130538-snap-gene-0.34 protein:Tk07497 transcript:maker-scaffold580_size130538-snap-gene-0.34-mRNA-1 annotation:"ferritin light oocyte isoform"
MARQAIKQICAQDRVNSTKPKFKQNEQVRAQVSSLGISNRLQEPTDPGEGQVEPISRDIPECGKDTIPIMKQFLCLSIALVLALVPGFIAGDTDTCNAHVTQSCNEIGSEWNAGPCNALYGGFRGNSNSLHQLMLTQFQDSFKLLSMGSYFHSDEVNRLGIHKTVMSHSDKHWANGKALMDYILQRGGRMGTQFKINEIAMDNVKGEVEALGATLDILKKGAERTIGAHRHSLNKKLHFDDPSQDSFDPALSHFLEEEFLESYTKEIRETVGQLNLLAKMVREDKTRAMGLHLFDQHLLQD